VNDLPAACRGCDTSRGPGNVAVGAPPITLGSVTAPAPLVIALAALLGLAALAGCGDDAGQDAPGATATAQTRPVTVYFADAQGDMAEEIREVPADADPLAAAMDELAAGPSRAGLVPALPPGTRVLETRREGELAVVDFSEELESGYPPGGAAAELAVVTPIVRTAADAGAARVRILVEGRTPAPVGAQVDFSQPLGPGDLP
jgi:spore germination protein GerM